MRTCFRACVERIARSPHCFLEKLGNHFSGSGSAYATGTFFVACDSPNEAGGVTTPVTDMHGDYTRCIIIHYNIARYVFDLVERVRKDRQRELGKQKRVVEGEVEDQH